MLNTEKYFPGFKEKEEAACMSIPFIRLDHDTELRILEEQDAAELFALVEKNRAHLRTWLPWVDATQSIEDERTFIHTMQLQRESNKGFTCVIRNKGQAAGTIGYHPIDWITRRVEIGYMLAASFQGKGLMSRACRAMVAYAFDAWQLNKVEIRCAVGNTRSCTIPQRLGFTFEGSIRQAEWLYDHFVDMRVYGMLASEWPTLS